MYKIRTVPFTKILGSCILSVYSLSLLVILATNHKSSLTILYCCGCIPGWCFPEFFFPAPCIYSLSFYFCLSCFLFLVSFIFPPPLDTLYCHPLSPCYYALTLDLSSTISPSEKTFLSPLQPRLGLSLMCSLNFRL